MIYRNFTLPALDDSFAVATGVKQVILGIAWVVKKRGIEGRSVILLILTSLPGDVSYMLDDIAINYAFLPT